MLPPKGDRHAVVQKALQLHSDLFSKKNFVLGKRPVPRSDTASVGRNSQSGDLMAA